MGASGYVVHEFLNSKLKFEFMQPHLLLLYRRRRRIVPLPSSRASSRIWHRSQIWYLQHDYSFSFFVHLAAPELEAIWAPLTHNNLLKYPPPQSRLEYPHNRQLGIPRAHLQVIVQRLSLPSNLSLGLLRLHRYSVHIIPQVHSQSWHMIKPLHLFSARYGFMCNLERVWEENRV